MIKKILLKMKKKMAGNNFLKKSINTEKYNFIVNRIENILAIQISKLQFIEQPNYN